MESIIRNIRYKFGPLSTLGSIHLVSDSESTQMNFCYCLEDTVRPEQIKVHGYTAIPNGRYKVSIEYSQSFKRDILTLSSVGYSGGQIREKINFDGIRVHGGNEHGDTFGCPLVAYKLAGVDKLGDYKIYGRADLDLQKWVENEFKKGNTVIWETKIIEK